MHIVMLSDLETQGGAAVSASRLAEALCREGHDLTRLVGVPDKKVHPWRTLLAPQIGIARGLKRFIPETARTGLDQRSVERQLKGILRKLEADVFNIHNLHYRQKYGWSPLLVRACAELAPTVWTLHDMWSFTGRCAYAYACRKFEGGCDSECPSPEEYPVLRPSLIAGSWRQRQRVFRKFPRMAVVTPSRWLAEEARRGLWRRHQVEVIPYGLPLETYKPVERESARRALHMESAAPVVMVAAQKLKERRKGGDMIGSILRLIRRRPLTVIAMGGGGEELKAPAVDLHALGYLEDEQRKVLAYNAADLLVHPAPVDNLPNVVLEALACGTPVAGFRIGGVPDMVRPGMSGWLADETTPESLAEKVDTALGEIAGGKSLRVPCRTVAEEEYAAGIQARSYLSLFESLRQRRS